MAFLEKECIGKGRPPIALVGHSIGAYIALHATKTIEAASDDAKDMEEAVNAADPGPSDLGPGSSANDDVPCPSSAPDTKAEDAAGPTADHKKTCSESGKPRDLSHGPEGISKACASGTSSWRHLQSFRTHGSRGMATLE